MATGDECSNVIQILEPAPTVPYPAVFLDTPSGAFEIEDVGFGLLAQTKAGVTGRFYRISPDVGASLNTICCDV
jgi:hypothetical protein